MLASQMAHTTTRTCNLIHGRTAAPLLCDKVISPLSNYSAVYLQNCLQQDHVHVERQLMSL